MSTIDRLITGVRPLIDTFGLTVEAIDDTGIRDNGVAILGDRQLRFRIESEQGNPSLEVASRLDPENWIDVSLLLNLASGRSLLEENRFEALVAFAVEREPTFRAQLTVGFEAFRHEVAAAEKARFKLMFPGISVA